MTALLRSWGSRLILILLGVLTTTMLLIHSFGMLTFFTICFPSKSSSFSLTLSLRAIGTRRGECCVGFIRGSVIMAVPTRMFLKDWDTIVGHIFLSVEGLAFQGVDLFVRFYLHLKKSQLRTFLS